MHKSIRQHISSTIRQIMRDRRLSQQDLAEATGLSKSYVSRVLSNSINLTLETIELMENKLGASIVTPQEQLLSVSFDGNPDFSKTKMNIHFYGVMDVDIIGEDINIFREQIRAAQINSNPDLRGWGGRIPIKVGNSTLNIGDEHIYLLKQMLL